MGAVGGVAILGGNFEAPTFPEDKVVQRSLTAGTQESSPIDAIILDALPLGAPGQLDSHATVWKGHSNDGSPHTIDWKAFVNVTADDGTGSLWTLQTRIDGAPYTDILTVDDNGLLTVSGATFTMDQLIIDSDNTEAVLIRKDGDAGDVFIVDTVNDVVRLGSDDTLFTFGASSDIVLRRDGTAGILALVDPGANVVQQELRIYTFDDGISTRYLSLKADNTGNGEVEIFAVRAGGGGQYDLILGVGVGRVAFWNEGVERWSIQGSVTGDFEFTPTITNRYDIGKAALVVRNVYTHGVIFGTTPALTGTIRLQNADSIVMRNAGDDGDLLLLSSPMSDEIELFDNANIPRVRFKNVHTEFDGRVTINTGTSTAQLLVGGNVLLVDTTNNIVTNSGGTIRGANSEAYALRDLESSRTVPTLIANRAELTTGIGGTSSQEISLIVDAIEAVRVDGGQRVRVLQNGLTLDRPARTTDGQTDSFDLLWVGKGFETATPHNIDWKAFVDVTADDGTSSIWTLQTRVDAGGFVDRLTIANSSLTLGLPDDLAAIHLGASGDAQIHRGDAADILEQRRGLNPQEWRLYDRFVSFSDYDRLAVYIGGGPPLKTIEFVAETSNASQGINIDIEALPGGSSDGRVRLITGTTAFLVEPSRFAMNKVFNISTASSSSMTVNGFISSLGFGFAPGIAINIDTFGSNRDSHSINMIGSGELGNRATWKTFVDVINVGADSIWTLQNDKNGGGFNDALTISNAGLVSLPVTGSSFAIGASPAQSGTIRLPNSGDIVWRNSGDSGDNILLSVGSSDEMILGESTTGPFIRVVPELRCFDRLSVKHTATNAVDFAQDNGANRTFLVDTTNEITIFNAGEITIDAEGIQGTDVNAFIRLDQAALVAPGFSDSPPYVFAGRSFNSGAHTREFRTFVDMTSNAGDGNWVLQTRLDAGSNVQLVVVPDNGRFAITQPEQVSIGSPTFIDNVQVNITGSFIDDYGGGPTTTHKFRITGSQTGDAGRTTRQTSFDLDAAIITQNLSQTINEVGSAFIDAPALTIGTDTVNIAYTLKVNNTPTLSGTENYGLLVDSSAGATNLTALTRIGKSFSQGIKLLVGGGVGAENLDSNAQMRLTNFYSPLDVGFTSSQLLHVHSTLQAQDGNTDHITGAFFEGTLRTQVEADENVANISQVRIDEPNIQDNLTGTGEITNAQSLLITGAPTEGESNYAQRILAGNLQIANASAFLFRNGSDSADLTALSMGASNFLEIGGAGSAEFEQVSIFSLGGVVLFATDDARVQSDGNPAFTVRSANGSVRFLQVEPTQTKVIGSLVVAASIVNNQAETEIQSTFADVATSAGSSVFSAGLIPAGSFLIGVTVRVLTTVTGPTGFDVGDGTDVDRWGNSIAVASGTTTDITDFSSGAVTTFPFANDVRLTSDGVDFTGGSVRITVHYITLQTSAA